jgi:hypothetical protein
MKELRTSFLHYCIKEVKPGWYVILNRNYKRLGAPYAYWVNYEQFMI